MPSEIMKIEDGQFFKYILKKVKKRIKKENLTIKDWDKICFIIDDIIKFNNFKYNPKLDKPNILNNAKRN